MRVLDLKLSDIVRNAAFDFSYPHCPQRCAEVEKMFPGLPLLIMDEGKRLVWGHDYFRFLKGRGVERALVLKMDIVAAEALLLNFNLSERLFGLNLFEKLLFVKKISRFLLPLEIQRRVELGFSLQNELFHHLDRLLHVSLRPLLAAGQLSMKAALRIMDFPAQDRRALCVLFSQVRFSESHQLLIMQLFEETAFREKKPLSELFAALPLTDLLTLEMPQQKIMAAIRRLRFPELSRHEDAWLRWAKMNAVPNRVVLKHVPQFASEEVQILVTAKNRLEAHKLLEKLK